MTDRGDWRENAECKNRPDLSWFPTTSGSGRRTPQQRQAIEAAIDVCRGCPVRTECAAERRGAEGIWGGVLHGALRPQTRPVPVCGTVKAYRRHMRLQEPVCDACKTVWAEAYHQAKDAATAAKVQAVRVMLGRTG